jgi:predicted CXXCH cytochrome family protein
MGEKSKHDPFVNGQCGTCHASHSSGVVSNLKMKSGELCLGCHDSFRRKIETDQITHKPFADKNCSACHNAHGTTAYRANLLYDDPELCLKCHEQIDDDWQSGVAHPPAQEQCGNCHDPHSSNYKKLLAFEGNGVCRECHEVDANNPEKTHRFINSKDGSCLSCHNPHGGETAALLHPESHQPFREGKCTPCHKSGRDQ